MSYVVDIEWGERTASTFEEAVKIATSYERDKDRPSTYMWYNENRDIKEEYLPLDIDRMKQYTDSGKRIVIKELVPTGTGINAIGRVSFIMEQGCFDKQADESEKSLQKLLSNIKANAVLGNGKIVKPSAPVQKKITKLPTPKISKKPASKVEIKKKTNKKKK